LIFGHTIFLLELQSIVFPLLKSSHQNFMSKTLNSKGNQMQREIETRQKIISQVWKFKMMNFSMGKEYFEFIINEEQEPTFTKIHSSQHQ